MVEISAASAAQEAVLRDVLAGLPATAIEALAVEPYDGLEFPREPGSPPWTPTPTERDALQGVALRLVAPGRDCTRAVWEVDLVAGAFRARSAATGPDKVLFVSNSSGGHGLGQAGCRPAESDEPIDLAALRATAATVGEVERLDVGECDGPVVTLVLRVEEPHRFIRYHARPLFEAAAARCAAPPPPTSRCATTGQNQS